LRTVDEKALLASQNPALFEDFIKENEPFIQKCTSKFCSKYISKNDDEWSVGIHAFSEAVKNYSPSKGKFLPFAEIVIKRRLIDFLRASPHKNAEIPVNPEIFSGETEDDEINPVETEVVKKIITFPDPALRDEILAISEVLSSYGFSFYDLTRCSPKAEKTRFACARAIRTVLETPELLIQMKNNKNLPIKKIVETANIPQKILERHRKYIIAAVEILSGDYPGMSEYLRFVGKENGK
jgi:RNA polymerase sigma factor